MDTNKLVNGLIMYLGLVVLLTFHEFGHAWVASKCGDDTARLQGRVSLNPLVHIDPFGTVVLPLLMIFVTPLSRFLIGYAKPVPVNPNNLERGRVDDIMVTLAGPGMNVILAVVLIGIARVGLAFGSVSTADLCLQFAALSLLLCFFNLIPIPPLDGSQVARCLLDWSYETYAQFARFGFIIIIVILQIPFVREILSSATYGSLRFIAGLFGIRV